jgi:choline dehydrogenase-like flavoprotein
MTVDFRNDVVDFVIVGSGAAGGVIARELAQAGHSVVILEQGPWRQASDFTHDEWSVMFEQQFSGRDAGDYQTFRHREQRDRRAARPRARARLLRPRRWRQLRALLRQLLALPTHRLQGAQHGR